MKIYYSYIDKYYKGNSSLTKREKEHLLGREMVQDISKSIYGIDDEIVSDGRRPHFKNNEIYFSISHSENIVVVAFDKLPIGIDVEYVRARAIEKLIKRYNLEDKVTTLDDFYRWWTGYEAKYKNQQGQNVYTFEILPSYVCSVATKYFYEKKDIKIIKY